MTFSIDDAILAIKHIRSSSNSKFETILSLLSDHTTLQNQRNALSNWFWKKVNHKLRCMRGEKVTGDEIDNFLRLVQMNRWENVFHMGHRRQQASNYFKSSKNGDQVCNMLFKR